MFAVLSFSRCTLNLMEYLLLDCTLPSAFPALHQHLSVMRISCTTSQRATEHLTKLSFLLGTWGLGNVSGAGGSFSPSKYKWPFQFQPLEVMASSGVQVQKAPVVKTLRYKTTVEQGICLQRLHPASGFCWLMGYRHRARQVSARRTCRGSCKA